MKRPIAILLLMLLMLQAVPVISLFAPSISYAYVEEDKPEETKLKEKKEYKEFVYARVDLYGLSLPGNPKAPWLLTKLPCPYLESFTPPPNAGC